MKPDYNSIKTHTNRLVLATTLETGNLHTGCLVFFADETRSLQICNKLHGRNMKD